MTLKIGLFGTGSFGNMYAKMLVGMDGVELSAICGTSLEKSEHMARNFRDAKAYASVTDMLNDKKLDAAYICVPPFAHEEIEEGLAGQGIPFFVEKPLATDLETPSRILKAVTEKNLITSVGYHFRYMDGTARALELLRDRTVGMALGYWMGGMPQSSWWKQQKGSGGQFVEQTTHIVDLLRYLLGEVEEVSATYARRHMHSKVEGVEVPDVGTVTLKMECGAVATIANTCMMPLVHKMGLDVYTDAGVLELSQTGLKDIAAGRTTEYLNNVYNRLAPYEKVNNTFIHAVRTGNSSGILSTYADAWRTQQITTATNRSAETGQTIRL